MLALKLLNSPVTARRGNWLAMAGMAVALVATMLNPKIDSINLGWIGGTVLAGALIGAVAGRRVAMTSIPQMVALLNGLGGAAVAMVALFEFLDALHRGVSPPPTQAVTTVLSTVIGSISFSGSLLAFGKLQELLPGRPLTFKGQQVLNLVLVLFIAGLAFSLLVLQGPTLAAFLLLFAASLVLGVSGVMPIGGADMPVVISLLNSFTGCAAGLAGFLLMNTALLIGGGLVGASGLILTLLMCKAMNRSIGNVLFGAVGSAVASGGASAMAGRQPKSYTPEDAAILLSNSNSVVIVPGYGMAVAQAQHQVKELADKLMAMGVDVKYAIHPVAGRMPGHMNVLLAEADVPYDLLYELEEINPLFPETDVALVIGANDVVNPAARYDKSSPIYGMPILDVDKARTVIVSKRSMNPGFAGVENELFLTDNCVMVFGSAKASMSKISAALDNL
ncbi:MAG: NAD(P)(+) transhydrogenase (Re/Si-specific) subunit beta [Fimbriimonas ginsengisoli]|uniref:NAD(P) transhydrogenase subunit beta n=1 Tax=Fimbriimonas ginsengisoli TaxID=1005039 RepID=A0A931PV48_FIMGI|nr:NAD(P)(+) transhydrogenase (Re/Si-specific) subunit beta [Fimbriimonas ginsengisoli]